MNGKKTKPFVEAVRVGKGKDLRKSKVRVYSRVRCA